MVLYRKDVAASLEYISEHGIGVDVYRPQTTSLVEYGTIEMASGPTVEKEWQKEVRLYDLNSVGIFGNSLDMIGYTASTAQLEYVDPYTELPISDPILQSRTHAPKWRDGKDIADILFAGTRALASVGEIDLVKIPDGKGDYEYDLFHVSQRDSETPNTIDKKTGRIIEYGTITYRLRDSITTATSKITVSKENVERCFVPQPGANHEAYAPARRVLPQLRLYSQIMTQFQRIAMSNSLMTKGVYLGEDDGEWLRDERYMSQFKDSSKAIPPSVNDMVQQARRVAAGHVDPWWPLMGSTEPKAIDLTTSFDEQAREQLKQCNIEIALGLNIPAKMLLGEDTTHFVEWTQKEELRTFAVSPLLDILIRFLDKHIYSYYPAKYGYSAKLSYNFDDASAMALNPAQLIEMFKIGVIGKKGIGRILKLSPEDMVITQEDIQARRELLTGDSGLQQAQLAERDAQQRGQQIQAVPDSSPLTNGNMRQGNENKQDVVATLSAGQKIKKKI